jgi:phosphoglycolate phosphatase-like HAD superfamily hydrolase
MNEIKVVFWDFDGVLIDSNLVRELGFKAVLGHYPVEKVDELLTFHRLNGGLSRYIKFNYFLNKILDERLFNEDVFMLAERFSNFVREYLVNPELLIKDNLNFIEDNKAIYTMFITSGSDERELVYLCDNLDISHLFKSIHGSPKLKDDIIKDLIDEYGFSRHECLLVGDSFNDYEAALKNGIHFMAYGNNDDRIRDLTTFKLF